jgi:uncharacterized membrane protein YoaK (UPF0700 family)
VAPRNIKKLSQEAPFFRPARSVSGTRRRVTTDELEQFKKSDFPWARGAPVWSAPASSEPEPQGDKPPPAPPAGSRPSMPAIPTPWVSTAPSGPPPPSPWIPIESLAPLPLPAKVPSTRVAVSPGAVNDSIRVGTLSAVAGYVDAAGFLSLFGLLPAHMTGDLVWAGAAVGHRADVGWMLRVAMMVLFIASVAVAAVAARVVRRRGQSPLASLLLLMTLALGVFWAAGTTLGPLINGPEALATLFISGAGVVAMGLQNALMREALGKLCPTTVMTGNLTQVTMELVELVFTSFDAPARRPDLRRKEATARLKRFGLPIAAFTAGALAGTFATTSFGFQSLAVPTLASLALTLHSFRVARA